MGNDQVVIVWPTYEGKDPKGYCGDPERGAAMGRHSYHVDDDVSYIGKIKIEYVPLDGDYDRLGTYWGGGEGSSDLWWCVSEDGEIDYCVRAKTHALAVVIVRQRYHKATIEPEEVTGIEDFFREYVYAALAYTQEDNSDDSDGCSLLANERGPSDIEPDTLAKMRADCLKFLRENAADIGTSYADAGKDFWHTRNEDDAGFWDGDWPDVGDRLTGASHEFGHFDLYVDDDGKIHA